MSLVVPSDAFIPTTIRALQQRLYIGPATFCIVGVIESERVGHVFYDFELNDATGRMLVRSNFALEVAARPEVLIGQPTANRYVGRRTWENRYVHATGSLCEVDGQLYLFATTFHLVQHADKISFHIIESAWTYLRLLRSSARPPLMSLT